MDDELSGDATATSPRTLAGSIKEGLLTVDNRRRKSGERPLKTIVAIKRVAGYFARWHQARFNSPLPEPSATALTEELLIGFIVDHIDLVAYGSQIFEQSFDLEAQLARQQVLLAALADEGARLNSLLPTIGTLQTNLRLLQLAYEGYDRSAFESTKVRRLRLMLIEAAATDGRVHITLPLVDENLTRFLSTCDETFLGLRDRALVLFALSVGEFPAKAVKSIRVEHLAQMSDGSFQFDHKAAGLRARHRSIALRSVIAGEAGPALAAWLDASKILDGPIFCGTTKRKVYVMKKTGRQVGLSGTSCTMMIAARAQQAELDGRFGWTSLFLSSPDRSGQAKGGAMPRNWQSGSESGEGAQAAPCTVPRYPAADGVDFVPILVFVTQKTNPERFDFCIDDFPVSLNVSLNDGHLSSLGWTGSVRIGNAVLRDHWLFDVEFRKRFSVRYLSPTASVAFQKLFGLLGEDSSKDDRFMSFFESPAGNMYGDWLDRKYIMKEAYPSVSDPNTLRGRWLRLPENRLWLERVTGRHRTS